MLKQSLYNVYVQKDENEYIMYNTLYGGVVVLNQEEYEGIMNLSSLFFEEDVLELLKMNGFVVDEKVNEFELFNSARKKILPIAESMEKNYTIAVTTDCNAHCYYCYEKNIRKISLDYEKADKIIEFIKNNSMNGERVGITWFGGEPTLNTKIITYICARLSELKISFQSSIISNGLLLTKELIEKEGKQWNLRRAQITLDGLYEEYDAVKRYEQSGRSPFITVLENICDLLKANIYVDIRINISKSNHRKLYKTVEFLTEKFPMNKNLLIYPAFLSEPAECELSHLEKEEIIAEILERVPFYSMINLKSRLYELPALKSCMRESRYHIFIDADGGVGRCEHLTGKTRELINSPYDQMEDYEVDYEFDKECEKCSYFPRCLGGCMEERILGNFFCSIDRYLIKAILKNMI